MVTVLIPTVPSDVHAVAVQLAIERRGHRATRLLCQDLPSIQSHSLVYDGANPPTWFALGKHIDISDGECDVIWHRRVAQPYLPPGAVHPDDQLLAGRELTRFYNSLWWTMGESAAWVNPRTARLRSSTKAHVLRAALEAGFSVPQTLISNDPDRIRKFIERTDEAVYKPFFPSWWKGPNGKSVVGTSRVSSQDLPSDDMLRFIPGIYQAYVRKQYELRVTIMGSHIVVMRVDAPDVAGVVDVRLAPIKTGDTKLIKPLDELSQKCLALMRDYGLLMATMDIAVDANGNFVFLDLNECGNFLFVEERHPEALLLQSFSAFLLDPREDFEWAAEPSMIELAEMLTTDAFAQALERDLAEHVNRPWIG